MDGPASAVVHMHVQDPPPGLWKISRLRAEPVNAVNAAHLGTSWRYKLAQIAHISFV